MKRKLVAGFVPALLVLLFMYTGFNKLFALADFTSSMLNQPIPHWLAYVLARCIPIAEIIAAGCLLFNATQKPGLYLSFLLLATFTVYISLILLHVFPKIPCSCAGIFRKIGWQEHLWINLALLTLTGLALLPYIRNAFTHH
ncbi:MAG TPA: MauE/DoxX family redox-associated membrane protein [Puia sp.]|nr:MauE/DoxX family redox-associated membrane protein [Puia sp.]